MNNYNFELANSSFAQRVLNSSKATGVSLFLFNKRYDDERAVRFLYQKNTPAAAIELYRKSLFKYDTFLPRSCENLPEQKFEKTHNCYITTKKKRIYPNSSELELAVKNNRKYWNTLGSFGYEETAAIVQLLSNNTSLVIGIHSEDHHKNLVIDRTINALESWVAEASEYIVDQSVDQYQSQMSDVQRPAYDLEEATKKLTKREFQVVCELLKGQTNKQIGLVLSLSEYTVDNHLRRIYKKFDVHNRTSLAAALNSQPGFSSWKI